MQEEIENRTVNLAVTTTRLSGRVLMDALRMYLRHRDLKKSRNQQTNVLTGMKCGFGFPNSLIQTFLKQSLLTKRPC